MGGSGEFQCSPLRHSRNRCRSRILCPIARSSLKMSFRSRSSITSRHSTETPQYINRLRVATLRPHSLRTRFSRANRSKSSSSSLKAPGPPGPPPPVPALPPGLPGPLECGMLVELRAIVECLA
uniref:(northern house mosquito) hypothetical protein n=1 Tax=Culex pipiens TaxID=7175 RepID=A0A8D8KAB1_CULPI